MFRNIAVTSSRALRTTSTRPFSVSTIQSATGKTDDKQHSVNKVKSGDHNDVGSSNVKDGMDAHKNGKGGSATERKDSGGGIAKAKKEFPESPDPAIGMQDERGGKGG